MKLIIRGNWRRRARRAWSLLENGLPTEFSEAKAYWILTNIFNVTDADYHTLQEQMFANTDTHLYDDGYYYSFIGGVGVIERGSGPVSYIKVLIKYNNIIQ